MVPNELATIVSSAIEALGNALLADFEQSRFSRVDDL